METSGPLVREAGSAFVPAAGQMAQIAHRRPLSFQTAFPDRQEERTGGRNGSTM